jgi:D-methionine transport system ATP-binding protein
MSAFIEIKDLRKTFYSKGEPFEVLKGVNLEIRKGEIYGIVGFSGAGKSTLIRCINRLEKPDSGGISVDGQDVLSISCDALGLYRQKIGIIFQQFNLLDSRTVFGNVAFPLEIAGQKKDSIAGRVREILLLVGLEDKEDFYPGQLSGGQKQRVGIARALANKPSVLLSDEATSALDPITTLSILDLLIEINKKLDLTIVLISHELDVIRYAANRMAVLEDGLIAESGSARNISVNPQSNTAKLFMQTHRDFAARDWQDGDGI